MITKLLNRAVNKLGDRVSKARLKRIRDNEDGVFIVLSLFILIIIFIAIGFAVDVARHEAMRVRLSATLDRAVLAAADLTNGRDPQATVEDYFVKAGFLATDVSVTWTPSDSGRTVSATARKPVDTWFMRLVGVDTINAVAAGTAAQGVSNVEVSLVVDLSMSMTDEPQGGTKAKFEYLKDAANLFVDTILVGGQNTTFVTLVPYGAQVRAGDGVLANMNTTSAIVNGLSYNTDCVEFDDDDFNKLGGFDDTAASMLSRSILFDVGNKSRTDRTAPIAFIPPPIINDEGEEEYEVNVNNAKNNCPIADFMKISPYQTDATKMKNIIEDFYSDYSNGPWNYTSLEIGAKWGLTFLDPSMREEVEDMAGDNVRLSGDYDVPAAAIGHPHDYTYKDPDVLVENQTMKVLVLMTDGLNTYDWQTRDFYKQTDRPSFIYANNDWTKIAFNVIETTTISNMKDGDTDTNEAWYHAYCSGNNCGQWTGSNRWQDDLEWSGLTRKTWPEVFSRFRAAYVADLVAKMLATRNNNNPSGGTVTTYFEQLYGAWPNTIASWTVGEVKPTATGTILGRKGTEPDQWDKLPYGFYELHYLNDALNSTPNPKNKDQRLQSLCELAKSDGLNDDGQPDNSPRNNIIIYTVGYDLQAASNANALAQLQNCATEGKFFPVTGATGLSDAFKQIANEIGKLRLTQ